MTTVDMSVTLKASAQAVWSLIGGFDSLPRWLPPVAKSVETTQAGAAVRRLSLQGGGTVVEQLERHDDKARSCRYAIISSPLPVANYHAELSVHEEGPQRCTVRWRSTFDPKGAPEPDAVAAIKGVYQAGFDSLKGKFGG
jgi:hypothetical protein